MAKATTIQTPNSLLESPFSEQLDAPEKDQYISGPLSGDGFACTNLREPLPEYIGADCELVLKNRNNAYIVLGRDRPAGRFSGYGGQRYGYNCGMIDLVVGRGGPTPSHLDKDGNQNWVDSNFESDAARIYISQTAKIDKYFKISENVENSKGSIPTSDGKSAIGIKADHVRVIARENIKLVTYTDRTNSKGQVLERKGRITLMANNDDTSLEPMVKGDSLNLFLTTLVKEIIKIKDVIYAFQKFQSSFNAEVAPHVHMTNFWGGTTKDDTQLKQTNFKTQLDFFNYLASSLKAIQANMEGIDAVHLKTKGTKTSILSAYCYLN
jgi:hypothetical protein